MKYRELESVVLTKDVADAGLRAGDLGAVVHVYGQDALEVELVRSLRRDRPIDRPLGDDVCGRP